MAPTEPWSSSASEDPGGQRTRRRQAPRVHIHYDGVGWSLQAAVCVALVGCMGVLVFAWGQGSALAWFAAVASGVWSVGVLLWMRWRACPGDLYWDGSQWLWRSDTDLEPTVCRVRLCMDFNHRMLVRVQPPGWARSQWLWLRRRHPGHWHQLRAVLCLGSQA